MIGEVVGGARLRAVCDVRMAQVRDSAGRHEYDSRMPDLSRDAVARAVATLGGPPLLDQHDEAHLCAEEQALRVELGQVQMHRRSPRHLLAALDLSVYDRPYAPAPDRAQARARHLSAWPEGIDAATSSLDLVSAPAAQALLPAVRGAAQVVSPNEAGAAAALQAHARLVQHLESAVDHGDPDPALGGDVLAALLGTGEALTVDLVDLEQQTQTERDRLHAVLEEACAQLQPAQPAGRLVPLLMEDHPSSDGVLAEARELTAEVLAFTRRRALLDDVDGECRIEPSPPSRRWANAMLSWAAPYEDDGPSTYAITPPDAGWPPERQRQWLRAFSRTTLPATTVHEVAPGHFAHGRALRRVQGDVRRTLHSPSFVEGWAHYAEELMVEEGFRPNDPRFAIGVAVKALLRVTRVRVALGVHTRTMTVEDGVRSFEREAFLQGPAARAEALRAILDPTYGRYTLGKIALRRLREQARHRWGPAFTLQRFHNAVLALGAPPLGLLQTALEPSA